jgi:hypothetical protein
MVDQVGSLSIIRVTLLPSIRAMPGGMCGVPVGLASHNGGLPKVTPRRSTRIGTIASQNTVARNRELKRVLRARVTDSPNCTRSADSTSDFGEGRRLRERNFHHRCPNSVLEIGASNVEGKHKVAGRALYKSDHSFDRLPGRYSIVPKLSSGETRLQSGDESLIGGILSDQDRDDAFVGYGDQYACYGRKAKAVSNKLSSRIY